MNAFPLYPSRSLDRSLVDSLPIAFGANEILWKGLIGPRDLLGIPWEPKWDYFAKAHAELASGFESIHIAEKDPNGMVY